MPERLSYPVPEAAEQLGVGTRTIWRWIKEGKLQTARLGSRVLVPRKALEAFLDAHTQPANSSGDVA